MTARSYTIMAAGATVLALVARPSFGQVNLGDLGVKEKAGAVEEKAGRSKRGRERPRRRSMQGRARHLPVTRRSACKERQALVSRRGPAKS
jgi:hypothetical protein